MIQHGDFPVNSAKFLRTPFFIEHFQWLLLYAAVLSLLSLWRLFLTLLFLKLSDFTYSFSKLNSMNISICFHNSKHDHGEENLIFITKEIHESFRGRKIYLAVFLTEYMCKSNIFIFLVFVYRLHNIGHAKIQEIMMMKNTQIICYLLCLKKNKEAITTYNFI